MKRKDFYKHEAVISSLKPSDLLQAAGEESRRVPFFDMRQSKICESTSHLFVQK